MREYIKIETPFNRCVDGNKKLIEGSWRSSTVEYLKDNQWICTEKVDGCLLGKTKLMLADGGTITIGEVVRKKLPVEILGMQDGKVVSTKVSAWHDNGITDDWYKFMINRRGMGTKGNTYFTLTCTGNHKLFIDGEWKEAKDIKIGDNVAFLREKQQLTWIQEQIITGLVLGDGSIGNHGRSIEFSHLSSKSQYIEWLLKMMGNMAGNPHKIRTSGYGSEILPARTISCYGIKEYAEKFISDGKKIIPKDIELSPISLAVFFMDDGSLVRGPGQEDRCAFAMNDYDEQSVDNFINALETQMHIKAVKFNSKGWNIRLHAREFEKLEMIVSPYICECMQYKLSPKFRGHCIELEEKELYQTINTTFSNQVIGIEIINEKHRRYDITTGTHNYFANGVLVHNCNVSVEWDGHAVSFHGRTEKAQLPVHLLNKLMELFSGEVNEELFEQKFGEAHVILYGEGYGAKIQKSGGLYSDEPNFILFDVLIGDVWLKRGAVLNIAKTFGIEAVPVILTGTLQDAINFVKTKPKSWIGKCEAPMEGLVCRPAVEVLDRLGKRVIVKVKARDFE